MATELTIRRIRQAFDLMRKGHHITVSFRSLGVGDKTYYDALRDHPDLKDELYQARGEGAKLLSDKLLQSEKGIMFILARAHGQQFGRHKEDEVELCLSDETRAILRNDKSTPELQIKAIWHDVHHHDLQLTVAERLIKLIVTAHPEMNKTEISGSIVIDDTHKITR